MDPFNPPHVGEDTPLPFPRDHQAFAYANYFRWAAATFREMEREEWHKVQRERALRGEKFLTETGLIERCGEWVIQANDLGLLPDIPELQELIAWHTAPGPPLPPGRQAMMHRCPSNLFTDLRGGGHIQGKLTVRPDGRKIVVPDKDERGRVKEFGGLLPRFLPGHLGLPQNERSAQTCEWLAKLVDAGGQPSTPAPAPLQIKDRIVLINGSPFPLGMTPERTDDALAFLEVLAAEPGNWFSSSDIAKEKSREGVRFDLVFKSLPKPVKALIESNRRKGYRLLRK